MAFFQIVDGYKNISRQQLEGIFTTPPIPKSFSRIAEGPNKALSKNSHLLYDIKNVHPKNLLLLHDLRREYLMTANQKNIAGSFNDNYIEYKKECVEYENLKTLKTNWTRLNKI